MKAQDVANLLLRAPDAQVLWLAPKQPAPQFQPNDIAMNSEANSWIIMAPNFGPPPPAPPAPKKPIFWPLARVTTVLASLVCMVTAIHRASSLTWKGPAYQLLLAIFFLVLYVSMRQTDLSKNA